MSDKKKKIRHKNRQRAIIFGNLVLSMVGIGIGVNSVKVLKWKRRGYMCVSWAGFVGALTKCALSAHPI